MRSVGHGFRALANETQHVRLSPKPQVQLWLDDKEKPDNEETYESFSCPAFARLHFIDRKTGILPGTKNNLAAHPAVIIP